MIYMKHSYDVFRTVGKDRSDQSSGTRCYSPSCSPVSRFSFVFAMPITGPGSKIPGLGAGDNVFLVQFNKVKVGDCVVVLLRGSHGGRYVGPCLGVGGAKLHMGSTIYYTQDKKGGLKRNVSKEDVEFDKEDITSCWVVNPAPSASAQQTVFARSRKRKVELEVVEDDPDDEGGNDRVEGEGGKGQNPRELQSSLIEKAAGDPVFSREWKRAKRVPGRRSGIDKQARSLGRRRIRRMRRPRRCTT